MWSKYNTKSKEYTTEYKKITIPKLLHLPVFRALRMFHAKSQLVGKSPIYFMLGMLLIQHLLSIKLPITSFLLPYILFFIPVFLFALVSKLDPNNPINEQLRNHAAEHLVSERQWFNRNTIYSYGCSNSHIIITFILNLILFTQMPVVLAYILSNVIAGEVIIWLLFHQDTKLAKAFYPLMVSIQRLTTLEPRQENIKLAEITLNKLRELELNEEV